MNETTCEDNKLVYKILVTCLETGYIQFTKESQIKSYINYFTVPKGIQDIRMVFYGTSYEINTALFASNFWLPISKTITRLLSFGYRSVYMDIGEMMKAGI